MTDYDRVLKDLGSRIRTLRKTRGLTQADLARQAGLYDVGKIERGESNPSLLTLVKVAETLGVDVADLFALSNPDADREIGSRSLADLTKGQPLVVRDSIFKIIRALQE